MAGGVFLAALSGGAYLYRKQALDLLPGGVSVVLLGVTGALVLSSLGHSANAFFISKDLWFWNSSPRSAPAFFVDRLTLTARSSLPATLALGALALIGLVLGARLSWGGTFRVALTLPLIALLPLSFGIVLSHVGGAILPAGKLRRVSLLSFALLLIGGLAWFRSLRIEQALSAEGASRMLDKAHGFTGIGPWFLPHNLGAKFICRAEVVPLLACAAYALVFVLCAFLSHHILYTRARDKAVDESPRGYLQSSLASKLVNAFANFAGKDIAPLVKKDVLAFVRDPAQWSQLILLGGLALLYCINAGVLRQGFAAFGDKGMVILLAMHVGLASFVAAGLAVRFGYVQMGLEGPSVWIVENSPLAGRQIVRAKFIMAWPIVALFPTLVAFLGGYILQIQLVWWLLSSALVFFMASAFTAFGVGRGALNPAFDASSISELAMGPGAMSVMLTSLVLCGVVAVGAGAGFGTATFVEGSSGILMAAGFLLSAPLLAYLFARRALRKGGEAFDARALVGMR